MTERARSPRQALSGRLMQCAWVWALVCAVVLAPALGRMHRVVHPGPALAGLQQASGPVAALLQSAADGSAADAALPQAQHAHEAQGWVHGLFAGHGPSDCQLLDQLHQAAAGPPSQAVFFQGAPAQACPVLWGRPVAGLIQGLFFDARAPPASAAGALTGVA